MMLPFVISTRIFTSPLTAVHLSVNVITAVFVDAFTVALIVSKTLPS